MRIGIDARMYGPRVGGGGLGRYVSQLVDHLQEIDKKNEYVLFLKKENFHECIITNPNFYKTLVDVHWYTVNEQIRVPQEVRQARVDFMHYPHWNVPLFSRKPFIVTIHDLILLEDRHSARSSTRNSLVHGFKYAGFRTVLENAIHRSKHIITVSEFTKSRILEHFGIRPEKISVIYNGILPANNQTNIQLSSLGIQEPYFLYVGNAYPHKNLPVMIDAFRKIISQHPTVKLVIAGKRDMFSQELEAYAKKQHIPEDRIVFLHLPTDEEIAQLYRHAHLFIYPSRIEGFGMPPLEAMTYQTPVAASHSASIPEVLQDAAHYFHPDDAEALANIMRTRLTQPSYFLKKQQQGEELASTYKWRDTAQQTQRIYEEFPTY